MNTKMSIQHPFLVLTLLSMWQLTEITNDIGFAGRIIKPWQGFGFQIKRCHNSGSHTLPNITRANSAPLSPRQRNRFRFPRRKRADTSKSSSRNQDGVLITHSIRVQTSQICRKVHLRYSFDITRTLCNIFYTQHQPRMLCPPKTIRIPHADQHTE